MNSVHDDISDDSRGVETVPVTERMHRQKENRDKIHVLQVVDKFSIDGRSIHGVARLMSWWAKVIDSDRFEMSILGLKRRSIAGRYLEEQGARVFYSDRGKINPVTLLDILNVARETSADILHLHGYKATVFGSIAGLLLRIPVIVHEHAAFPNMPSYQKVADRLLAPLSDRAVVNCQAVAEFCLEYRGMPPDKIDVVFNGVPLDEFRHVPDKAVQEAAAELGLNPDTPVVGTVARLDEQKGVTYLIQAIPLVKAKVPGVKFLIVGDGTLRDELEEEAERLGVADDVIFTGERRDVSRLYRLMDVKVISSIYEGTTLTVFEAMAAGTPVVATAVDGVKEVIEDGRSGLLVESRHPEAIAEAVLSLLKNEGRRGDIAAYAEEHVRVYDVRISMRRIEAIYEDILNRRTPARKSEEPRCRNRIDRED